jgi:hypothetical protein
LQFIFSTSLGESLKMVLTCTLHKISPKSYFAKPHIAC